MEVKSWILLQLLFQGLIPTERYCSNEWPCLIRSSKHQSYLLSLDSWSINIRSEYYAMIQWSVDLYTRDKHEGHDNLLYETVDRWWLRHSLLNLGWRHYRMIVDELRSFELYSSIYLPRMGPMNIWQLIQSSICTCPVWSKTYTWQF